MSFHSDGIRLSEFDLELLRTRADRVGMERSEWLRRAFAGWAYTPAETRQFATTAALATPRRGLPPTRYGAFWWSCQREEESRFRQTAKAHGCFVAQFAQILIRYSQEQPYAAAPKVEPEYKVDLVIPMNDFDRAILKERAEKAGISQAKWLRRALNEWECPPALGARYLADRIKTRGAGVKMFRHGCAQVTCTRAECERFINMCTAHQVPKSMYARVLVHYAVLRDR